MLLWNRYGGRDVVSQGTHPPWNRKSWSLKIDYSRVSWLGADQKTRGLWERDWRQQSLVMRSVAWLFLGALFDYLVKIIEGETSLTWCCRKDKIKPYCGCIGASQKKGLFASPMIELCDIFSLDNHLPSFRAISGAAIFYGSRLGSRSQKYVFIVDCFERLIKPLTMYLVTTLLLICYW